MSYWLYTGLLLIRLKKLTCSYAKYIFFYDLQTINDWYDRDIDAINEPYRPIPSGAISEQEVPDAETFLAFQLLVCLINDSSVSCLQTQVITQVWVLLLGGLGIAGVLDVWVSWLF